MLIYVPLDQIDDNPFQERQDYSDVDELAGRIAAKLDAYPDTLGLMQVPRGRAIFKDHTYPHAGRHMEPDEVRKYRTEYRDERLYMTNEFVRVQLAFGHRRARAFRHLHQTAVPGYEQAVMPVHVDALTDDQMLDAVWSENRERKDISAVEEARLLARKLERVRADGGSQRDVANAWGLARPTVANRLRLLELPEDVQAANQDGRLSERQCLALAPVLQLQQTLNGRSWDKLGDYWNRPNRSPAEYVQAVVADGSDATSDDIRKYARLALEYAGQSIPKCIAKHQYDALPGIQQPSCKGGCPLRINNTCLDAGDCLAAKKEDWAEYILGVASEELGIPVSDRPEDFLDYKHEYKRRNALRAAREQNLAVNFVIGWQADGAGVRPYRDENNEYLYGGEVFGDDGRNGIVLGTRGPLSADVLAQVAEGEEIEVANIPDRATRDAWQKEANKYQKAAGRAARKALVNALYASLDGEIIQALMCPPDEEWLDDHEALVGKFVKFMWGKGRGVSVEYSAWMQFAVIEQMLNRAGLKADQVLTTGTKTGDMRRRAIMALTYWYHNRDYSWYYERALDALTAVFAEFESAGPWADEEMANLHYELGRAMDDVEMKMEKEADDA